MIQHPIHFRFNLYYLFGIGPGLFIAFLKKQYDINTQDYRYWLHVIAMRQLDGKDFTTGYATRIDAVTPEKTSAVLSLLENGTKIEYVIKKR